MDSKSKQIHAADVLNSYSWHLYGNQKQDHDESMNLSALPASTNCGTVVYNTSTFRAICTTLDPACDFALEIGCSYGKATKILSKRIGSSRVLGVDTSKEALEAAKKINPEVSFLRCDVLATPHTLLEFLMDMLTERSSGDDHKLVVLVDIGGNRELEALAALLPWVAMLPTRPHRIIVKSQALYTTFQELRQTQKDSKTVVPDGNADRESETKENSFPWLDGKHFFPHPLKAPLRKTEDGVPICRFHNYQPQGCKLYMDPNRKGTQCPYDHDHCHYCGARGHVSLKCPTFEPLI
eukprot:GSChrysophyteH1.ASY1.ANO1.1952.1 assembled CDS